MADFTNSDKIANTPITLELHDGFTVEMRQLTIKQTADLDAYVRGRFIKNTIDAVDGLDESVRESVRKQIIPHMAIAAQQMTWIDKAATVIFETEENGMAYYTYKHVENTYPGDFNSWKDRFNTNREENMRLFFATRYVLTFMAAEALNPTIGGNKDPEAVYKMIDAALKAGLALDTILEMTPAQINMVIGDRDKIAAANDGKIHFSNVEEFKAYREARRKEEQTAEKTAGNNEGGQVHTE